MKPQMNAAVAAKLASIQNRINEHKTKSITGFRPRAEHKSAEFWMKVDTMTITEEMAQELLNESKEYPFDESMAVAVDFTGVEFPIAYSPHSKLEQEIKDGVRLDTSKYRLVNDPAKGSLMDRMQAMALKAKVVIAGPAVTPDGDKLVYCGVRLNNVVHRTGKAMNVAMALAAFYGPEKCQPVLILAEPTVNDIDECPF